MLSVVYVPTAEMFIFIHLLHCNQYFSENNIIADDLGVLGSFTMSCGHINQMFAN